MKTTLDISDNLYNRAKALAERQGTTLRALVEEGLSQQLALKEERATYLFNPPVFEGTGIAPEFADAGWEKIRAEIYPDCSPSP